LKQKSNLKFAKRRI